MKYLVDTNVWLELLLEQERASEVRKFFQEIEARLLALTEFSLYSIGVILIRLGKDPIFEDFLSDTIEDSGAIRIHLETTDLKQALVNRQQFNLDFDDAYQYTAAERYDLTLISFDSDFDRTTRGRKTPAQILEELSEE